MSIFFSSCFKVNEQKQHFEHWNRYNMNILFTSQPDALHFSSNFSHFYSFVSFFPCRAWKKSWIYLIQLNHDQWSVPFHLHKFIFVKLHSINQFRFVPLLFDCTQFSPSSCFHKCPLFAFVYLLRWVVWSNTLLTWRFCALFRSNGCTRYSLSKSWKKCDILLVVLTMNRLIDVMISEI